ncbi:PQQ-binding-like beta-propeller repeat protein [Rubinisphaera margarita]|uniref:PQQ-binding-like beta-propeller repeat protein n=1 Tax=Rubinisphaera margarita TaxID=2909586 RepID=UPI001EE83296|nr:PQQ-binding-like beta-propeller repeat protein [Rubinisphaera margarita]MCG6155773.1 PQQ-like beta-propeller repeat protein [Rubinisphaera margarita]
MKWTTLLLILLASSPTFAADWPQWMGPQRDNVWRESGIVEEFGDEPRYVWKTPIAGGYAGPSIANGRVYVTDYVTKDNVQVANFERELFTGIERVMCLDQKTGREHWKHEYPVQYTMSYPAGPRCTPNVHDGHVYTLGGEGNLICFNADSGDVVWSKNLPVEYATKTPLWGYAAHPLIEGDTLITLAGGQGSLVVALDLKTGNEVWRSLTSKEQGYAPPRIIQAGGKRQLVVAYPEGLSGLDPATGKEYWTTPYQANNGSIIMTPVHAGNYVYVGGFNNKNLLVELGTDEPTAKTVWRDQPRLAMSPVNVQPFLTDDKTLIGFDQSGQMLCLDLLTGERIWQSTEPLNMSRPVNSGTAFIVKNDDRFFLFNEQGELIIARLSREGYDEVDSMKVIEPTNLAFGRDVVWSAPAYADKCAFIRNDKEIVCVDLSAR